MRMLLLAAMLALAAVPGPRTSSAVMDVDRDGLDDRVEQRLIERFQPRLRVSKLDCAERPSAFVAETTRPIPAWPDGTIYARVHQVDRSAEPGAWIEVQYFHLWAQDCGWNAHALDVEHVSTLLRADSRDAAPDAWTARYWYAAAHQDTVCDASHGARAESLGAADRGAMVWIARGKHASYLTARRCRWGCGSDRCPESVELKPAALVNLGERDAPLNGATWVAWSGWPLGSRLQSDFTPQVISRIDRAAPGQVVAVNDIKTVVKAFLTSTSTGAVGLLKGRQGAGVVLGATGRAMGKAVAVTGRTLIGR
jgi:hypothetical protein